MGRRREGETERVLSRDNPEVDDGWLCDRGRFARHEPLADRLNEPLCAREPGSTAVRGTRRRAPSASACATPTPLCGPGSVAIVTGGNLTNEEAYAWGRIAREVRRAHRLGPVAAAGALGALDPYAARIDDLDRADVIVVVGDGDVADRAGVRRPAHPQGAPRAAPT